jgi:excinuclease ABC subunit B
LQASFNEAHGIVPRTVVKSVRDLIEISRAAEDDQISGSDAPMTRREREEAISRLEKEMRQAAKMLEFEYAAMLRDKIIRLRAEKS